MSEAHSYNMHKLQKKVIKIKPVEKEKESADQTNRPLSVEEEHAFLQTKLQSTRDELESLKKQRELMLHEIKEDIKHEKVNWEKEKETLIKQAEEKGYNAGFAYGKKESMEKYEQLLDKANSIVNAATSDYHSTIEQSDEMIVELAVHTAEKITKQTISDNEKNFLTIVTTAIKEIKDQSVISIFLHPNNYESILQQKNELVRALDGDTKISIYIDQKLTENGCLIEHPFGRIDASIDTQLHQIKSALQEVVRESKE